MGATGRIPCRSTPLPAPATATRTGTVAATAIAGRVPKAAPRAGRACAPGLGVTAGAALAFAACLARTTGTVLVRLVRPRLPACGRCLGGPSGTLCRSARVLGTAAGRGAVTVRLVGAAGASPPAIRRSCRASAPDSAGVAGPVVSVASTASSSAAGTPRLGRRRLRPSRLLGV